MFEWIYLSFSIRRKKNIKTRSNWKRKAIDNFRFLTHIPSSNSEAHSFLLPLVCFFHYFHFFVFCFVLFLIRFACLRLLALSFHFSGSAIVCVFLFRAFFPRCLKCSFEVYKNFIRIFHAAWSQSLFNV